MQDIMLVSYSSSFQSVAVDQCNCMVAVVKRSDSQQLLPRLAGGGRGRYAPAHHQLRQLDKWSDIVIHMTQLPLHSDAVTTLRIFFFINLKKLSTVLVNRTRGRVKC